MPRMARLKSCDSTYHIMVMSISEVLLYVTDKDKDRYLKTLKKYQDIFRFKVYGYCIMDTHAHFIIYANGADISKIMHGLNQSYAQYYNRKYGRHGHLFQDRFKSKIIDSEGYLLALSGYIHNNPSDIREYEGRVEAYTYSSLGVFLGKRKDSYGILDPSFVLKVFGKDIICARKQYIEFIQSCTDIKELPEVEFENEPTEYRSEKNLLVRNISPTAITSYISRKMGLKYISLNMKRSRELTDARALCVFFMRCFCDLKCKDICTALGNITQPMVSKLCSRGVGIVQNNRKYRKMVEDLFLLRHSHFGDACVNI